jgi:hypothetical protein
MRWIEKYKGKEDILKELKTEPVTDNILIYENNWIQDVRGMQSDRHQKTTTKIQNTGLRNRGRPQKRILEHWDRKGLKVT